MATTAVSEIPNKTKENTLTNEIIEIIRVLHIDDDENQQTFLKIFIENDPNIKITSIKNACDIIELVKSNAYDCLITDYDMPDCNGLDLTKQIREFSQIPIIIYTGRGSEEIAERAFASGVDDYIRKEQEPAHYQVVGKRIRQAVERHRSNESYKSLFDSASDAIILYTLDGKILDINEAGCKNLGYPKDELLGTALYNFFAPNGAPHEILLKKIVDQGQAVFESIIKSKDGSLIPVEVSNKVVNYMGSDTILSFNRDISERKQREAEMRRLATFPRLNPNPIVEVDLSGKVYYTNPAAAIMFPELNRSRHISSLGLDWEQMIAQIHKNDDKKLFRDSKIDGLWYTLSISLVPDSDQVRVYATNIDERVKIEESLRLSEERYRDLFENASDAISIIAFDGHIIDVNEVGCQRYGYLKDEFRKMKISQYVASPGFEFNDYLTKLLRKGYAIFEATHVTKEGKLIPVEVHAKIIKYEGVDAILSFSRDISDRKRLEAQMKERLEALQSHALNLGKCEDTVSVAKNTYKILQETMGFDFFGLAIVKNGTLIFIPNLVPDDDWNMSLPLDAPGVCARAVKTRASIIVPDVRLDPDYIGPKSGYTYFSEIVVPVKIGDRVIGIINVEDKHVNHFTQNDLMLLEVFSEHVASALYRIELLEKTKRYLTRIDAISRHTARLAKLNTVRDIAEYSMEIIRELIGFGDGCIGVVEGDVIKFKYAQNPSFPILDQPVKGKGVAARAVRTGKSQNVSDTRIDPDFVKDIDPDDYLSELDVPVKVDGVVVAVINLEDPKPSHFSEEDQKIVEAFAVSLGSAMRRIWLLESVRHYTENLEALKRHAENLTKIETVEGVARYSYEVIEKLLGFNEGAFGVVEGEYLKYIYAKSFPVEQLPSMPLYGKGISVRAVKTGKSQLIPDTRLDPDFVHDIQPSDIYSELDVPVKTEGKVIAVINLEKEGVNTFSYDDQRIVEVLSEQVASALSRIKHINVISASQEALTQSEERFKYILDSAPEGVTINVLGKLVYTNDQFTKMIGYTSDELLTKNIDELHEESYKEFVKDRTRRRSLGENVPSQYEVELVRKDGSILPVEYSVSQIVFKGENASLTFIRDVTERKKQQELEKKLNSLHRHARVLNELQTIPEVADATLEMLHSHLNCNLLSIRSVKSNHTYPLAQWGKTSTGNIMSINGEGVTSRAAREKRSMLIRDTRLETDFVKGNNDSLSELAVPILCRDEVLGVLNAESLTLNSFNDEDRVLMETLADEVGSAFKRIQSLELETSYNNRLDAFQTSSIKLTESRTVEEALDSACEILENVFGYDWVGIGKVDDEAIEYVRAIGAIYVKHRKIPLHRRSITVRAVKTGITQLVPDTSLDEDYIVLNPGDARACSELVVPITVNDKIEFVINIESQESNAFSNQDKRLIELLSLHFASTIGLIKRREKLNALHLHGSKLETVTSIREIARLTLDTLDQILHFNISSFHVVKGELLEMIETSGFTMKEKFTQTLEGPGLIPLAVREHRSIYVPDVTQDDNYVSGSLPLVEDRSSEYVVPFIVDGESAAAINLESKKIDGFKEEDREMIELLSQHVTSAMHKIRHIELIKASEERYQSLLDNSMDSVIVIQGTRIVYANPAAARLRGYTSPNEIIGRDSIEFIPKDEKDTIRRRQLGKQLGESHPVRYMMRLLRRDGSVLEVENVASRISFDGKPAILAVARDVTHVRRLEESLVVLHSHAVKLGSARTLDEVSAVTVDAIKSVMGFNLVSFLTNEGGSLRSIRNAGSEVLGWSIPINGKGITAKAAREKRTILINDLSKNTDFLLGSTPSLSELATPVIVGDELVAVLNVESTRSNAFSASDVKILETLALHVSSAFERMYNEK